MDSKVKYTLNILTFDFLGKSYYVEEYVSTLFTFPESTNVFVKDEDGIYNYAESIEACNYFDFFTDTRGECRFTLKEGEKVTKEFIEELLAKSKEESCKRLNKLISLSKKHLDEVETTSLNLEEWKVDE